MALRYGIPVVAEGQPSRELFQTRLRALRSLVSGINGDQTAKLSSIEEADLFLARLRTSKPQININTDLHARLDREYEDRSFAQLTRRAIEIHLGGATFTVSVTPEEGHHVSTERYEESSIELGPTRGWVVDQPQVIELVPQGSASGLEELTPTLGAKDFTDTAQPGVLLAAQAFLNQPGVAAAGPFNLSQAAATKLLGRFARGGLFSKAGSITGLEETNGIVVGDTQVINQVNPALRNLTAFIPLGDNWDQVRVALGEIGPNDLIFLEAGEPNLTPQVVEATLTRLFGQGPSARAVLTEPREVQLLSAAALTQVWSSNTLPRVVTLGIAVQLRDQQGQLFNLVIWV